MERAHEPHRLTAGRARRRAWAAEPSLRARPDTHDAGADRPGLVPLTHPALAERKPWTTEWAVAKYDRVVSGWRTLRARPHPG